MTPQMKELWGKIEAQLDWEYSPEGVWEELRDTETRKLIKEYAVEYAKSIIPELYEGLCEEACSTRTRNGYEICRQCIVDRIQQDSLDLPTN